MSTFNGPAFAAEALRRIALADEARDDLATAAEPHGEAAHLRETAQTFATLALVAATLGDTYSERSEGTDTKWNNALTFPQPS